MSSVMNQTMPTELDGGDETSDAFYPADRPPEVENLISVVLWLICSGTIIGNILVVTAFIRDRELRAKPANLFILNLSVSDLLIGSVSITFYNIWRHTGDWIFGEVVCKLWTIVDYSATTQSAVAIVLISFDRVVLVSQGLKYRKYITIKLTLVLILSSWVWSFCLNSIPILCSDALLEPWVPYELACDFAILYKFAYKLTTSVFSFVIPFFCLAIFNIIVYNNIRARSRGFRGGDPASRTVPRVGSGGSRGSSTEYNKHRKAAITLALIVGVFLICWLPWYAYKLILLFAMNTNYSSDISDVLAYLLWANSAINPLLYAVTHPRIRSGLLASLLCCAPYSCKRWMRVRGGASARTNYSPPVSRTQTTTTNMSNPSGTRELEVKCNRHGSSV